MSTGAKIALALVGLVVIYFIYAAYKKRKDEEAAKAKEPSCKDISIVKWTTEKRELQESIYNREMQIIGSGNSNAMDFVNAYRTSAIEAGYEDFPYYIIEYGAWVEAHKKMLEKGYCEQLN